MTRSVSPKRLVQACMWVVAIALVGTSGSSARAVVPAAARPASSPSPSPSLSAVCVPTGQRVEFTIRIGVGGDQPLMADYDSWDVVGAAGETVVMRSADPLLALTLPVPRSVVGKRPCLAATGASSPVDTARRVDLVLVAWIFAPASTTLVDRLEVRSWRVAGQTDGGSTLRARAQWTTGETVDVDLDVTAPPN